MYRRNYDQWSYRYLVLNKPEWKVTTTAAVGRCPINGEFGYQPQTVARIVIAWARVLFKPKTQSLLLHPCRTWEMFGCFKTARWLQHVWGCSHRFHGSSLILARRMGRTTLLHPSAYRGQGVSFAMQVPAGSINTYNTQTYSLCIITKYRNMKKVCVYIYIYTFTYA